MTKKKYPEEYYQFFIKFNEGEYYECHDLLEEIWMTDKRNKFLQGLLQVAVAIYHFQTGNIRGSRLMFNSALNYLKPYPSIHWDLNLMPIINYIEIAIKTLPNKDKITIDEVKKVDFPIIKLNLMDENK